MVTYWLFQFMGAFTAAAVYKIVCNLAALHTAPQVCRVLPKVLAMHSSRNFFAQTLLYMEPDFAEVHPIWRLWHLCHPSTPATSQPEFVTM